MWLQSNVKRVREARQLCHQRAKNYDFAKQTSRVDLKFIISDYYVSNTNIIVNM